MLKDRMVPNDKKGPRTTSTNILMGEKSSFLQKMLSIGEHRTSIYPRKHSPGSLYQYEKTTMLSDMA